MTKKSGHICKFLMLLVICLIIYSCGTAEEFQFQEVIKYLKQDSTMIATNASWNKGSKQVDLEVSYRTIPFYNDIEYEVEKGVRLTKQDLAYILDIDGNNKAVTSRVNAFIQKLSKIENSNVKPVIDYGRTRLSTADSANNIVFLNKVTEQLIQVHVLYKPNLIYNEERFHYAGSGLIYNFFFDKSQKRILKVTVGDMEYQ